MAKKQWFLLIQSLVIPRAEFRSRTLNIKKNAVKMYKRNSNTSVIPMCQFFSDNTHTNVFTALVQVPGCIKPEHIKYIENGNV